MRKLSELIGICRSYPFVMLALGIGGLLLLLVAGHWGITREPCWAAQRFGAQRWGSSAFDTGTGDCAAKPWWRP